MKKSKNNLIKSSLKKLKEQLGEEESKRIEKQVEEEIKNGIKPPLVTTHKAKKLTQEEVMKQRSNAYKFLDL